MFCRDKHVFVATKMILVAAPANDSSLPLCIYSAHQCRKREPIQQRQVLNRVGRWWLLCRKIMPINHSILYFMSVHSSVILDQERANNNVKY